MAELPAGTVTFLFTDLESSTRRWEEHPEAMPDALARHDAILRHAVESRGGFVVKMRGDGVHAAFGTADDAVMAAIAAELALREQDWGAAGELRVRAGVHSGTATLRDGDYYGPSLNRAARLTDVAHGGQIVCSQTTADLARDELGEDVRFVDLGEHRLRDLSRPERVFQVSADGLPGEFGPLRSLDAFPGNLPLQLSSLVGRDRELARTGAALDESRVVTLTGVGGVGKTRLALLVAADVLPGFRHGAWLCELEPVRNPNGVIEAVASVFDVVARSDETLEQTLILFLADKQLLLVLDNCEHLLEPVAALVETVERSCPSVRVLATSREGLGIDGERMLAVPSLTNPAPGAPPGDVAESESVRLFVERARARKAEFDVTAENADAVAEVCRRLDGVPLAIELAAARVPAMNPRELAARLDHRFDVLAGGRRGAVERHQTLQAVIDWSYDLLDDAEQRLLARVTVFSGGWTLDAAEAVCAGGLIDAASVFGLTERLVARSLIVAEDDGFQTRYRLLEMIRQYGEERLAEYGETTELRLRHAEYCIALAGDLSTRMSGPEQIACARRLAAEHENMLAAMRYAIDTDDTDTAFRMIRSMPDAMVQVGYQLRFPIAEVIAMRGAAEHPDFPLALAAAAFQASLHGDHELANRYADEASANDTRVGDESVRDQIDTARIGVMAARAMSEGAWTEAARLHEQQIELHRSSGRSALTSYWLAAIAVTYSFDGDTEKAIPLATEGLDLARQVGAPSMVVLNLTALASALAEREPERARSLLRESIALRTSLGYEATTELTQSVFVAGRLHDWSAALDLAASAVPLLHWTSDRPQLAGVLNVVARAVVDHDPESAAVLQGASRRLALPIGSAGDMAPAPPVAPSAGTRGGIVAALRRETTALVDEALGTERRHELSARGDAMDEDEAVTCALDAITLARQVARE